MTRRSIRKSISFRGTVRGCADHQWLITDAIWEAKAGPETPSGRRWIVSTGTVEPTGDGAPVASSARHHTTQRIAVCDLATGWTTTAETAEDAASKIRAHFGVRTSVLSL